MQHINPAKIKPLTVPSHHRRILFLDKFAYIKLVQSSVTSGCSIHGKLAHAHIIKTHFNACLFLQNSLINMYERCGHLDLARQMFDEMPERNVVTWNSLICGYTGRGLNTSAVKRLNWNSISMRIRVC